MSLFGHYKSGTPPTLTAGAVICLQLHSLGAGTKVGEVQVGTGVGTWSRIPQTLVLI